MVDVTWDSTIVSIKDKHRWVRGMCVSRTLDGLRTLCGSTKVISKDAYYRILVCYPLQ